ncbi:fido domain-containing protein [Pholiota molesta]|nr:fido domain-containing protein [Pholiota molesta]
MDVFHQAQAHLLEMSIVDQVLDDVVERYACEVDDKATADFAASERRVYYQIWKPTKQHVFPTTVPHLPLGHQEAKDQWTTLTSSGSTFYQQYLRKVAIETNHVESTFLVTGESMRDVIQRGIADAEISTCRESALHDTSTIRNILHDTIAAYELLLPLADDPASLDKSALCRIHAALMKTCRFVDTYTPLGMTRSATRKTVFVAGTYNIQCCPFNQVDAELDRICNLAKQWSRTWRNPFATASWLHLVLVRCHPFEDGNGRLTRLIASIPLIRHGYPPLCIPLAERMEYYDAINKAYTGDHRALAEFLLQGMRESMASVQSLGVSS